MANFFSFLILCIFLYGRSLWSKNLTWHIRLMLIAFVSDLTLILVLVFGRDALSKVDLSMSLALKVHIPIAILTIVFYFPTLSAGYRLYRGQNTRMQLRRLDKILTTLRILTFLTSLWVQFAG